MDPFHKLARGLHEASVRFVLIGVWGANYWAHEAGVIFTTRDRDLAANSGASWPGSRG